MIIASTVHFPYMTAWPQRASAEHREATAAGFSAMAQAFRSAKVKTVVVVSTEHIVNLQPKLAPSFTVGTGERHPVFPEPHFNLPTAPWNGHADLARQLVECLYEESFDVAHSSCLQLDHGSNLPLAQLGLDRSIRVVPLIINSIFAPFPSLSRCLALGRALTSAFKKMGVEDEVGILATGGLSHAVGTPGMDVNSPAFDRAFFQQLLTGDLQGACSHSDASLDRLGNGTHEIRTWLVAAGAAADAPLPRPLCALPYVDGWHTGVYQLLWEGV